MQSARDLVGKRVVTSFEHLATEYFRKLDAAAEIKESSNDGDSKKTEVQYISGSVEAACALGLADAIGICTFSTFLPID